MRLPSGLFGLVKKMAFGFSLATACLRSHTRPDSKHAFNSEVVLDAFDVDTEIFVPLHLNNASIVELNVKRIHCECRRTVNDTVTIFQQTSKQQVNQFICSTSNLEQIISVFTNPVFSPVDSPSAPLSTPTASVSTFSSLDPDRYS